MGQLRKLECEFLLDNIIVLVLNILNVTIVWWFSLVLRPRMLIVEVFEGGAVMIMTDFQLINKKSE